MPCCQLRLTTAVRRTLSQLPRTLLRPLVRWWRARRPASDPPSHVPLFEHRFDGARSPRRLLPSIRNCIRASPPPSRSRPADWLCSVPRYRAPSRAPARTSPIQAPDGRFVADRGRRQHADRAGQHRAFIAQDIAEHVLGEHHVEALADSAPAAWRSCPPAGDRARRPDIPAATSMTTRRQSCEFSSTFDLSTLRDFLAPLARQLEGHARDALDFRARVGHGIDRALFRAAARDAARRAVIEAAGQFADDDHVGAFDQVVLQRRGIEQRRVRAHRAQIGDRRPAPCECRAGPLRDASRAARYRTPAARPRPSAWRRPRAPASRVSSGNGVPVL